MCKQNELNVEIKNEIIKMCNIPNKQTNKIIFNTRICNTYKKTV